jgi:hypothetical protein
MDILGTIGGFLGDLYGTIRQKLAADYQFVQIGQPGGEIVADTHYVAVRLLSFRTTKVRNWGTDYTGVVHSFCTLNDISQGHADYQQVSAPSKLAAISGDLQDRVIEINKTILDQVPYEGRLAIQTGVFSVKTGDKIADFIKLADQVSNTAGVGFLKVAQPFFPIVQSAADMLLGNSADSPIEIGLDIEFPLPGRKFTAGTYAVVQATKAQLDGTKLTLDPNSYRLLDASGNNVTKYPYMVIAIEGAGTRANWMESPELRAGWNAINDAFKAQKVNEAEDRLKAFRYTCLGSTDLVTADAKALYQRAVDKYGSSGAGQVAARDIAAARGLGEFHELDLYGK